MSRLALRSINKSAKGQWLMQVPSAARSWDFPARNFWWSENSYQIRRRMWEYLDWEKKAWNFCVIVSPSQPWAIRFSSVLESPCWIGHERAILKFARKVTQINRQQKGTPLPPPREHNTFSSKWKYTPTKQTMTEQLVALLWGEKTLDKKHQLSFEMTRVSFKQERSVSIDKTIDVCRWFFPQARQCADLAGTKKVWATTTTIQYSKIHFRIISSFSATLPPPH